MATVRQGVIYLPQQSPSEPEQRAGCEEHQAPVSAWARVHVPRGRACQGAKQPRERSGGCVLSSPFVSDRFAKPL